MIRRNADALKRAYASIVVIVFNTLLLVVAGLFLLSIALDVRHWILGRDQVVHSSSFDPSSYRLTSPENASAVGKEFDRYANTQPFVFNPWTTFMIAPFRGVHLNVVEADILNHRSNGHSLPPDDWPIVTIWLFGGSTAFGFGVPDNQTVAAHIEALLSAEFPGKRVVVNFGQPYWFTNSERAAFTALLSAHRKPDLALFLDGVNDISWRGLGYDRPVFSHDMHAAWERARDDRRLRLPWISVNASFPLARLRAWIKLKFGAGQPASPYLAWHLKNMDATLIVRDIEDEYRKIVATAGVFGVKPHFFLQPAPWFGVYKDATVDSSYRFGDVDKARDVFTAWRNSAVAGAAFHDLSMVLLGEDRPYVDSVHYSDHSNLILAKAMIARIRSDIASLPESPRPTDKP